MKFTLLGLLTSILLPVGTCSPRELLAVQRPLTATEIERVVSGVRGALAGKTLRLADRYGEREILVGPDGAPRMVRIKGTGERIAGITSEAGTVRVFSLPDVLVHVFEYSPPPARRCDGTVAPNGMVIEYLLNFTTLVRHVSAREPGSRDAVLGRPLEMLRATQTLAIGGSRVVGTRKARALVLALPAFDNVMLTGDPAPDPRDFVPTQSLWIDVESLLPLRWELSQRQAVLGGADFVYEPLAFERPSGFEVPTCIP